MRALHLLFLAAILAPAAGATADVVVFDEGGWVRVSEPAPGSDEALIGEIRQRLDAGQSRQARNLARDFIEDRPLSGLLEEAYFLAGEAELQRNRLWQAFEWYEKQLDNFPTGRLYERALVREMLIARKFLDGQKKIVWGIFRLPARDDGLEILQRIAERLPGSELAEESLMTVGDYHFSREHWLEAASAYQAYLDRFGQRFRSVDAEMRAARAMLNSYRGYAHDDTPLLEAEQRYLSFRARYPDVAAQEDVSGTLHEIEQQRAQKDYETARFYRRIGRDEAAAFYYREVMQLYPDTPYANLARNELQELDLPAGAVATEDN